MKLHYYKLPDGTKNFGDDLNPWLWEQLLPGLLTEEDDLAFVGIGTLINETLPNRTSKARRRIIFGTGVGYSKQALPKLDESYKIYCLRGPLSARALGVEDALAITDGAALIRKVVQPGDSKVWKFAYMPHYELAGKGWERVCQDLGFGYIDPRWSVEKVLSCIRQTEVLLAEAMHGAIIADALRVPWIPIVTNSSILSFKWQDWCSSVELEYKPTYINRLHHPRSKQDLLLPVRTVRDYFRQKAAASELRRVALQVSPVLSRDATIERLTAQLDEKLQQLKADVGTGVFA